MDYPHRYLAYGNSKGEVTGRTKRRNNSKKVVRNLEKMNVSTNGKNLTSAKDKTIELPRRSGLPQP